ncbi:MAG: hypothetical protein CVU69_11500 [Deltaproteobacteria bacterium HGW-Deltaproteobacteria-4]|nr:MAG: hypothetical protein CVU69_11500 [Deltaproteobacteria bacterium HGW-Deltaproteobacteria-4]
MILVLCLGTLIPPVFAYDPVLIPSGQQDFQPRLVIAMVDPPAFLAPLPCQKGMVTKEKSAGAITPFIDTGQVPSLQSPLERPAIAADDVGPLERTEVTAGVDINLGTVKFNLGYTLPSDQVDELVRPFGVDIEPGSEGKCFKLGVQVPF